MAPMCMYASNVAGTVEDFHLTHYESRAIGGIGSIIVEATAVEERGVISVNDLGIWSDTHIAPLQELTRRVKRHGTHIGIQLAHAGRKAAKDKKIVSSSSIGFNAQSPVPSALSKEEIAEIVSAFAKGASRAVEAGFDFIELHAAHGYLMNQFMSAITNNRTDDYGGSITKRSRFLLEVIEAVKRVIPKEMPLGLRVSAHEYIVGGNDPNSVIQMLNMAKEKGIKMVNVSSGGLLEVPVEVFPGYQLNFAQTIKEHTKLIVIAGGLIDQVVMAQEVIGNNRADLIFIGRALLRNPYLAMNWAAELGRNELITNSYKRGF